VARTATIAAANFNRMDILNTSLLHKGSSQQGEAGSAAV